MKNRTGKNNIVNLMVCLVSGLILFTSCADTKKTVYFSGSSDSTSFANQQPPQSLIQNNDILSINVSGLNKATTEIFNTPNIAATTVSSATGTQLQASGYLVNADGFIQFPVLGNLKVSGLTTLQLRDQLTKTLSDKKLVVDPVVTVRQLNFKVSILGEVNRPTVINVPNEQITLLEALGLAGDLTIFGRRDNVLIIRQESQKKVVKRINLNTNEIFTSPFYYLKANDVVYVEPNNAKITSSSRSTQLLPIILSGLSFVAIIVGYVINRN